MLSYVEHTHNELTPTVWNAPFISSFQEKDVNYYTWIFVLQEVLTTGRGKTFQDISCRSCSGG